MTAAVADYKVASQSKNKMKKEELADKIVIELEENPDILKAMGNKKDKQFLVGFAAETENLEEYARKKLEKKNLDMIIANDVSREDTGFNVDFNEVIILTKDDKRFDITRQTKNNIAKIVVEKIINELKA